MNQLPLLLAGALSLAGLLACAPQSTTPATGTNAASAATEKASTAQNTYWSEYRARSEATSQLDKAFIAAELKALGLSEPTLPAYTKEFGFETKQPDAWFSSAEGQRIMDIIVSFQTPSGGWSKRTDMAAAPRAPGMAFGVEKDYIPTFDNGAGSTQMALLAKAYSITGKQAYADAFYKGLDLIVAAQYPNGGWPQSFPLTGGYHDHITYNDALMRDLMRILHNTSLGKNEFAFVSAEARAKATASLEKGLECVLNTQVQTDGVLTIWGAQHDALTLQPAKARAYEMASLSTAESVAMLEFLMDIDAPSPELINAIHSAMDWYEQNKILGYTWQRGDGPMTADPSAPPMWSRFVEVGSNLPIFGDRDGSIHYEISKVSQERREGYAWFTTAPNKVLKKYAKWAQKYPREA